MILSMDGIFKISLVKDASVYKNRIGFEDPHEVERTAKEAGITPEMLLIQFSFYLLHILRLRVMNSIETQTINGMSMRMLYRRLSLKYKKQEPKNTGRFWKDTEFLMNSIKVFKQDGHIKFGIPRQIKHPTNGTPAYLIFRYLEGGTRNKQGKVIIPPRPLILPHLKFMVANIIVYYNYFVYKYYGLNRDKFASLSMPDVVKNDLSNNGLPYTTRAR